MSTTTLKKYLTFTLFIVVVLGLTIGASYLLKPIKQRTDDKFEAAKYEVILGGVKPASVVNVEKTAEMPETIISIKRALDSDKKDIAMIYETKGTNNFGSISITASVDPAFKVLGFTYEVKQTASYIPDAVKYIEAYKGQSLANLDIDSSSRPSANSVAAGTIDMLFEDMALAHGGEAKEEPTDYVKLFGEDYTLGTEEVIKDGEVSMEYSTIKKYPVLVNEEVVAYTYFVERDGVKVSEGEDDYGAGRTGSIEIQVITDIYTSEIIGTFVDVEKYGHSKDNDKDVAKGVLDYLNKLSSSNILAAEYTNGSIDIDEESGATKGDNPGNSVKLVMQMLTDLAAHLKTVYTVGEVVEVKVDGVLTKQVITISEETYTIYHVRGYGIYDTDYSHDAGQVVTELILDETGNIVSGQYIIYEHSLNGYDVPSIKFLDSVVKNKTNISKFETSFPVDSNSGATKSGDAGNSVAIIIESFKDLALYIKGGK